MSLISISEFCSQPNPPGVATIEYLPTDWVDAPSYEKIVNASRNWQYDIPLTVGAEWLSAPIFPSGKLWEEQQRVDAQGTSYEHRITGITPRMRPDVTDQFEQMAQYDYLLRLTDKAGQIWLIGTLEQPMQFSAAATSGTGTTRNQYSLTFSGSTSRRAYGFLPEF